MPAATSCLLCRRAAESKTSDARYAFCRDCCRTKLLPLIASALGKTELQRAANEIASEPSEADKKIARLIAARPGQAGAVPSARRPLEFSRGTGTPARPATPRRRMSVAEQRLAVARYAAKCDGQVFEGDIAGMVKKAGLRVNNGGAELSIGTAGTGTTTRPATGKKAPPSKAQIAEMVKRAGLDVA
jgi:hypothetical protein